jgi:hypothetical protein
LPTNNVSAAETKGTNAISHAYFTKKDGASATVSATT